MSMKNPLTPAGIEPATYRFVAQHLNHCATAVRTQISNFTKVRPVGVQLFHTDGRKDRHDEANSRFPQLCERA